MYIFSLLIGIGVVLGLTWTVTGLKEKQAFRFIDSSLGFLLGGLVGGRAVYVAVHWAYYQEHLRDVFMVWSGGFSAVGAVWGCFLVWLVFSGLKVQNHLILIDQLLPLFMLVAVTAWLGGWLEGVAYGPLVAGAWWSLLSRDQWGVFAPRFPTQLLGAILTLGWFWVLESIQRRKKHAPGWSAAWGFFGVSMIYTSLSFLRADPIPVWLGLRLDVWGGFSLIGLSFACLLLQRRNKQP